MNGSWNRGAFTLVELLVVVGIICLLNAILLPVLLSTKQRAVQDQSTLSLHQLAMATVAYSGDCDELLPPYRNDEALLVGYDPRVTTSGIPTDSPDPRRLVECLRPYGVNHRSLFILSSDPYQSTDNPFGLINHRICSFRYVAWPNNYDLDQNPKWPIVTSTSAMEPPAVLFREPTGTVGRSIRSYWSAPVYQTVLLDGTVKREALPQD